MKTKIQVLSLMLVGASVAGCQQTPAQQLTQQRRAQLPTATEVFNLRSKCAKLGQEVSDHVSTPYTAATSRDMLSNYSVKENRCYITLEDIDGRPGAWRTVINLYDGQTRERLAWAEWAVQKHGGRRTVGWVGSIDITPDCSDSGDCGYVKADLYIDSKMKREE